MGEALVSRRGGSATKCKITNSSGGSLGVRFTEATATSLTQGQSVEVPVNSIVWISRGGYIPAPNPSENCPLVYSFNGTNELRCVKGNVAF
ncbi:hypothetical protein [Oscillibacter sp.]|uniref:hypothetical protein n=1 Tax=Oscillibacter sp. TaxID=1945593 RepID=UPI00289CE712|nr:hypothetical protein [Oscillibacter sp.]